MRISHLKAIGTYAAIALMPGGLLVLFTLFVMNRRDAIGIPWR